MFTPERRNAIKKIIRQHRRMHFEELQRQVDVSPATLRRDLTALEQSGDIIRVHGGVLDRSYFRTEASFDERVTRKRAAKKAIAAAAALLVPSGATVLVDAGTTCLEVGKILLTRKDVRLITNSVTLVQGAFQGEATIWCLGGELRKVSGALVGAAALGALNSVHAEVAFIGATGLDEEAGCFTTELFEAEMKQAMISSAARKILLADSTKWQKPSAVRFAGWQDFDDWFTDELPDSASAKRLRALGLHLHRA